MNTSSSRRLPGALIASAMLALGGLVLAGCASAAAAPEPSSTTPSSDAQQQGPRTASGVSGLIAYAEDGLIQVQGSDEQTAVRYTGATTVTRTVSVDASAIAVGSCVTIVTVADGTTATSVTVTDAADDGSCGFGMGVGGGFPGNGDGSGQAPSGDGARPSGEPSGMPTDAPDGSGDTQGGPGGGMGGVGGVVSGAVTAVGDGTLTVESTGFGDDAETTSTDVSLGADTTITGTVSATTADIATGLCVTARGEADDAGGYDATSLVLSDTDQEGECSTGVGGFPGGGRMPGAGADGQGDSE